MTFHRSGGSVPPPPPSTPPSTLGSVLPPLPRDLEADLRQHAARRQIRNASTVSTPRLVQGLRRGPRTPSTDRLLAAVDEAASPPTRAEISMRDGGSVGHVVPPAPRQVPPRRNTPEPGTAVPASEVRLDELPNWPTLRAAAAALAPDLPLEALDRAGKWRGLPKWGGPDAELVVGIARAILAMGMK